MGELKPGWTTVPFGQMVESVGATRKSRGWSGTEAGFDRYVGLEHIDSNSLSIKRWGSAADVGANSDLRPFEPGDVIFARRRIYQRKVGLAGFRGVASGHALVFRAKPDVVLPAFLPFLLQSDVFMTRADRFSAGSLSQTVNLSTLLAQEFALPPLKQQEKFIQVLNAVESTDEELAALETSIQGVVDSYLQSFVQKLLRHGRGRIPLFELSTQKPSYGANAPACEYQEGMPRFIRITDIDDSGRLKRTGRVGVNVPDAAKYRVREGDLLVARTGSVGKTYLSDGAEGDAIFAGYLIRFRLNPSLVWPRYIFWISRSSYFRRWVLRYQRVGVQPNINATEFRMFPVPLPTDIRAQRQLATQLDSLEQGIAAIRQRRVKCACLKRQIMGGMDGVSQ